MKKIIGLLTSRQISRWRVVFVYLLVVAVPLLGDARLVWGQDTTDANKPPSAPSKLDNSPEPAPLISFKQAAVDQEISWIDAPQTCDVLVAGELFVRFHKSGFNKPILHPVFGPGQIPMTRDWPMVASDSKADSPAKKSFMPTDHPHHKSIWLGHIINGKDFWTERDGKIEVFQFAIDRQNNSFSYRSKWIANEGAEILMTDHVTYQFGADDGRRSVDVTIEFQAVVSEVVLEDTKEGTFAIRMHPDLQFDAAAEKFRKSNPQFPPATAFNSERQQDQAIWGRPARWVAFQGSVDRAAVSLLFFDHPKNLRHPTTWHARDYGLVAANPFGCHDMLGMPRDSGSVRLAAGEKLTLKYRMVFGRGAASVDEIETLYREFINR